MTEQEWLMCGDPEPMIPFLETIATDRKARLCAVACCRHDSWWCFYSESRRLVLLAEAFADGLAEESSLPEAPNFVAPDTPAHEAAARPVRVIPFVRRIRQVASMVSDELAARQGHSRGSQAYYKQVAIERKELATVIREVFGNPFHSVSFNPAWRTTDAVALARQIYELREFSAMPILADALQDAGCDNELILSHCRDSKQAHVRGCWVVDLLLGKV